MNQSQCIQPLWSSKSSPPTITLAQARPALPWLPGRPQGLHPALGMWASPVMSCLTADTSELLSVWPGGVEARGRGGWMAGWRADCRVGWSAGPSLSLLLSGGWSSLIRGLSAMMVTTAVPAPPAGWEGRESMEPRTVAEMNLSHIPVVHQSNSVGVRRVLCWWGGPR